MAPGGFGVGSMIFGLSRSALAPASGMFSPFSSIFYGKAFRDRVASASSYRDRFFWRRFIRIAGPKAFDLSATTEVAAVPSIEYPDGPVRLFRNIASMLRKGCLFLRIGILPMGRSFR